MDNEALSLSRKKHLFRTLDSIHRDDPPVIETIHQQALSLSLPYSVVIPKKPDQGRKSKRSEAVTRPTSSPMAKPSELPAMPEIDRAKMLTRRATEPSKAPAALGDDQDVAVVDLVTQSSAAHIPTLKQSVSSPAGPSKDVEALIGAIPRPITAAGKRKRNYFIEQVPESRRCFSNCVFYFFPNNDIDKTRRFRITKTIEYGATWARDWHSSVTHIIMDKGLSLEELFKHTILIKVPRNTVAVDEIYLSDCLQHRALLSPTHYQSLVKGFEPTDPKCVATQTSPEPSDRSLSVKPAKGRGMIGDELIRNDYTPSPAEEDSEEAQQSLAVLAEAPRSTYDDSANAFKLSDDALNVAIAKAKGTAGLLVDSDDEDGSRPPSRAEGSASDNEEEPYTSDTKAVNNSNTPNVPAWQAKFTCMQAPAAAGTSNGTCPNAATIALLQQMSDYYSSHDQWRHRAYRIAISALKKHPTLITTAKEASRIPGIGTRLALKIEEIHLTSRLRRLENALLEPSDQALKLFLGIYGVGPALASTWVQRGLRTLDDLKTHNIPLTDNQRLGLAHYDDFATRIPRTEVAAHGAIVAKALRAIDPDFEVTIGGSYRRGAATSGDVDMLISHPSDGIGYTRAVVLDTLIPRLVKRGFLVAALAVTGNEDGTKWHGACQLPAAVAPSASGANTTTPRRPWRRIDLLLVPSDELGAALLYFTGNDIFNRSMRLLARKKGMRLNQRGLYRDVMRGKGGVKLNEGVKIAGRAERDIFRLLGVPWREITERDC